jgi:hypothetical protein
LAAFVTRAFIQEDKWNVLNLRAALRGAVLGVLVGGVMVGLGIYVYDFDDGGWLCIPLSSILIVVNAINTAILRPGKTASRIFWGMWIGCALLAGPVVGLLGVSYDLAENIAAGVLSAGIAGTVGGLLAVLATRKWIKETPDTLKVG